MTLSEPTALEFVEVHIDGRPVYIRVDEIQRFEAVPGEGGEKTKIVFRDGSEIIVDESPEQLKEALRTVIIIRTHTR